MSMVQVSLARQRDGVLLNEWNSAISCRDLDWIVKDIILFLNQNELPRRDEHVIEPQPRMMCFFVRFGLCSAIADHHVRYDVFEMPTEYQSTHRKRFAESKQLLSPQTSQNTDESTTPAAYTPPK